MTILTPSCQIAVIIGAGKIPYMNCISSKGICGEHDFRYLWEEEARTPGVNERDYAGQKVKICFG